MNIVLTMIWQYVHVDASAKIIPIVGLFQSADMENQRLTIIFDKDGVVKHYVIASQDVEL